MQCGWEWWRDSRRECDWRGSSIPGGSARTAAAGCLIPSRVRGWTGIPAGCLGSRRIPSRRLGWRIPPGCGADDEAFQAVVRAADSAAEERESPPRPAKKSLYPWQGDKLLTATEMICCWCNLTRATTLSATCLTNQRILLGSPGDCNALPSKWPTEELHLKQKHQGGMKEPGGRGLEMFSAGRTVIAALPDGMAPGKAVLTNAKDSVNHATLCKGSTAFDDPVALFEIGINNIERLQEIRIGGVGVVGEERARARARQGMLRIWPRERRRQTEFSCRECE